MKFDLDQRRARLSVGELSEFSFGPRDPGEGRTGIWRAHLGAEWHRRLAAEASASEPGAQFEVAIEGPIVFRGWTLVLSGRIDQLVRGDRPALREIKTVTRELPADEALLRSEYPAYFVQLAAYAALLGAEAPALSELVFVEMDSGLAQTVTLVPGDAALFHAQIERVAEFLELRLRARERRLALRYRPPFGSLRPGQEGVCASLASAIEDGSSAVLLQAPTGFGKTGVLLEFALGQLKAGLFERVVYLTSKSTGQLQVIRTLAAMAPGDAEPPGARTPVSAWHVRNKAEHCIHSIFHCVRDVCPYIEDVEARWPKSGLSRFYLFEGQSNDIDSLRSAGRSAAICPYEITRASLAFNDIWVGDYNYVFSPANRGLFFNQPGFEPGRTLLLIDEAHNLPSRVAGVYSHAFLASDAFAVADALAQHRAPDPLVSAWNDWCRFLDEREPQPALAPEAVAEARRHLETIAERVASLPLDFGELGPFSADLLWRMGPVVQQLGEIELPLLWWSPRRAEVSLTCLDAAAAIGATLREFGGVVLATATPGPLEVFSDNCGTAMRPIEAWTPWREGAYDIACDLRVDTTFQHRTAHYPATAAAVAAISRASSAGGTRRTVAVFFPSYAYAEAIAGEIAASDPNLRFALQPRRSDLAAQAAWVEESLGQADALALVLGSSFAESIDLLGGRITHAMIVGPALPEVNPVQRAKLATLSGLGREAAFRRVYQVPGMLKVNQALGRLVRAPGQRAKVLLHCRRFAEPGYAELLAPDYRGGTAIRTEAELEEWLVAKPVEA